MTKPVGGMKLKLGQSVTENIPKPGTTGGETVPSQSVMDPGKYPKPGGAEQAPGPASEGPRYPTPGGAEGWTSK
jgi:hypothetical protein